MKTVRQITGKRGEDIAAAYLEKNGYQIIKRNYRAGREEIDIVARDREDIVFIEVKTIRSFNYGEPESRISLRKQRSIIKGAYRFLNDFSSSPPNGVRFDVICIRLNNSPVDLAHYKYAFWQER